MRLIRRRRLRRFEGSSRSIDIAPADAPIRTLPLMKSESNSVEDYKVERTTLSYSAPSPAVYRSTVSEVVKVCQDEKVIEEEDDEDFLFFTFAASPVANHDEVGNLRYMPRPLLPGSLDEVKDLKTADPHGVSGCCKTKQNLSGERIGKKAGIITQLADIILHNFKEPKGSTLSRVGEDNSSHKKIECLSSKKTKEMSKQKTEYVMDAVYVLLADREEKKGSHKEGRPLSAPVELCYVALCWSMIRKQRV
ncbi:hypothetical protein Tco_0906185 [Tanacetum coccineum]